MIDAMIVIVIIALTGFIGYDLLEIHKKKKAAAQEAERVKKEEQEAREQALKQQAKEEYARDYGKLVEQFGEATSSFVIGSDETKVESYLYVFESSSIVYLRNESIPFSKILGFDLNDDTETIFHNEISYRSETSTNTGSLVGRALVGGLIGGGVGALIGANTASTTTTITPIRSDTSSTVKHKYSLLLNIDDLSNPIRAIKLGADTMKSYTIANIVNIIVQRNNINQ